MRIEQPGPTKFTQLSDVPQTFLGGSLKTVSVNAGETALEFTTGGGGAGTVTDFIFTNANGITGVVTTSTTTPTLSVSIDDSSVTSDKMLNVNGYSVFGKADTGAGQGQLIDIIASSVLGRGPTGNVVALTAGTGITISDTEISASGSGGVSGQALVDFGSSTGENSIATTTVSTASALTASIITVTPSGTTTAEHDPDDYQWDNISGYVSNIINGVSFDIIGVAPNGSFGNYRFNYVIN